MWGYVWEYIYYKIFDISSMSDYEYGSLIGHFNQLGGSGDFEKRLRERGYTKAMIEEYKKRSEGTVTMRSLNLEFKTTDNIRYPLFDYIYTLYDAYERRGTLPFDGSLADQPAKVMEMFSLLRSLEHERDQRQLEEQKKEAKRAQRK